MKPTDERLLKDDKPRKTDAGCYRAPAPIERLRDQGGRPFEIVEIPMPRAVEHDGERLPATYVNFYFINGALLVPTYRDKRNDRRAIETLR